jgi:hypothetical protein
MPSTLSKNQRSLLAEVTLSARDRSESAARAALEHIAVHEKDYRPHMSMEQRELRNRLRARGRALGDKRDERAGTQQINRLTEAVAYEHWHRLLFTRFLADNDLLHTDEENGTVPITLAECEDLAPHLGARDGFDLACRFASRTLPGVFRSNDPVLDLRLATNDEVELRRLLGSLPKEVFQSDDALGWTYQFWQTKRKEEVNRSETKIGADELPAVTQLFTEDYMVEFLLHNTLGAWWAGKCGAVTADDEEEARRSVTLAARDGLPEIRWNYLRFIQDAGTQVWTPAAGTFDGWPKAAKDLRLLDPSMGSGHFLVFALPILARLRLEEENVGAHDALTFVLRDNLFGLELDERCTQIAAFNVALTAWKLRGWQSLPPLHLACSGLAPNAPERAWVSLAGNNDRLRRGMAKLHSLFKDAPVLGSLINPKAIRGDLVDADFHELHPLLEKALASETNKDDERAELGVVASGIAKAAEILASEFTTIATNVPYLGRGKQDQTLKDYCDEAYPRSRADLATAFIERCVSFATHGGTSALVTPHSWLFLGTYKQLRKELLSVTSISVIARLGPGAFESIGGEVVNVALVALSAMRPKADDTICSVDVSSVDEPLSKATALRNIAFQRPMQLRQLHNADAVIQTEDITSVFPLLSEYAEVFQGVGTTDNPQYLCAFWEIPELGDDWEPFQFSPEFDGGISGLSGALKWQRGHGPLASIGTARKGLKACGRPGFAISVTGGQKFTRFLGYRFDNTIAVILPRKPSNFSAIGCFLESQEFKTAVRRLDQALSVTESSFVKVPFDLESWKRTAAKVYPRGLPPAKSNDATQWLFYGHPKGSDQPLHVAVARLLGYRWPRQSGSSFPDCPALGVDGLEKFADTDGIVCLSAMNKEQPAATRVRELLSQALGKEWGAAKEHDLLRAAGSSKANLEDWLRDEFFEQHCALFHSRPFLWHVWDGRKDGFHALLNYHRLDNATLQKLTYSYLGDWIRQQERDAKSDKPGAAERLGAARVLQRELVNILKGVPPYDIFIRWKSVSQQPVGWNPDSNDGVRLNIRPFMKANDVGKKGAGILRSKPNIKWDKDRGKEPMRPKDEFPWFWSDEVPPTDFAGGRTFTGHRWNDVHLTLEMKRASHSAKRR